MANLNIRVDDTLKKQAETIFSEHGLSLSAKERMEQTGGTIHELLEVDDD